MAAALVLVVAPAPRDCTAGYLLSCLECAVHVQDPCVCCLCLCAPGTALARASAALMLLLRLFCRWFFGPWHKERPNKTIMQATCRLSSAYMYCNIIAPCTALGQGEVFRHRRPCCCALLCAVCSKFQSRPDQITKHSVYDNHKCNLHCIPIAQTLLSPWNNTTKPAASSSHLRSGYHGLFWRVRPPCLLCGEWMNRMRVAWTPAAALQWAHAPIAPSSSEARNDCARQQSLPLPHSPLLSDQSCVPGGLVQHGVSFST